jgi:hypothetical protein
VLCFGNGLVVLPVCGEGSGNSAAAAGQFLLAGCPVLGVCDYAPRNTFQHAWE